MRDPRMIPTAPAIFLDFDGTITLRDATDAILEAFADSRWVGVEEKWKQGRIGSRECLASQMALVNADRRDVDALLDDIEVDPGLVTLLEWGVARGTPIHIVSDGFDYCIQRILQRPSLGLGRYLKDIPIVSSHLESDGRRWRAIFTSPGEPCIHGCATCKPAAIERLSVAGAPRVFVGDGLSDRYAAATANVVFAKDALAAYCVNRSIPHTPYAYLATVAWRLAESFASETAMQRMFPGKASPTT
jgi:2-hydroxy-3-keto-5-methylthiopentenyl-1-phosphate phosphatase